MPLLWVLLFVSSNAIACPEIIVPVDPQDTSLRSHRWRKALKHYKARRFPMTLKHIRKTARAIEREAKPLFHSVDKPASNRRIQRWLQRHMYTRFPSILTSGDGFTFPVLVWWAWADVACRTGHFQEAKRALLRLAELRSGNNLRFHQALVDLRLNDMEGARKQLRGTVPDPYLSPYLEGLIAAKKGDVAKARSKLHRAANAATLREQREAAQRVLQSLPQQHTPDDSR